MLQMLENQVADGNLRFESLYFAYCKKDPRVLAHADAMPWDEVDPKVRVLLAGHLYKAIGGPLGEKNFVAHFTGDVVDVGRVAPPHTDPRDNRPAVEILEAIAETRELGRAGLIRLGNALAHKLLAVGPVKTYVLAVLRFQVVPSAGARPLPFAFATLCDLTDETEEPCFDERRGTLGTTTVSNLFSRTEVSKAVFFPCLDEHGEPAGDLLVYDGGGSRYWWQAFECSRRLSARRAGKAVVNTIAKGVDAEVPAELFAKLAEDLLPHAAGGGLRAETVAASLERHARQAVNRHQFVRDWAGAFGDADYAVDYQHVFGEAGAPLHLVAGEVQMRITPRDLGHFRQTTVGGETFVIFRVPARARVKLGKELDLHVAPVAPAELLRWMGLDGGDTDPTGAGS